MPTRPDPLEDLLVLLHSWNCLNSSSYYAKLKLMCVWVLLLPRSPLLEISYTGTVPVCRGGPHIGFDPHDIAIKLAFQVGLAELCFGMIEPGTKAKA